MNIKATKKEIFSKSTSRQLDQSQAAARAWRAISPERRLRILTPLIAHFGVKAAEISRLYIAWQVARRLPGITGEANTLQLIGKGVFVAIGDQAGAACISALAFGNAVLWALPDQYVIDKARELELVDGLIGEINEQLPEILRHGDIAGVLFGGDLEQAKTVRDYLARREGAITELIGAQNFNPIKDFYLLAHERTLTINTAAAGGNAELLSITD